MQKSKETNLQKTNDFCAKINSFSIKEYLLDDEFIYFGIIIYISVSYK